MDSAAVVAPPTAVLVHLSGPHRGHTRRLAGDRLDIYVDGGAQVRSEAPADVEPYAHLQCRGLTYELMVEEDKRVWVNGEPTERMVLASGDVLEIGRGGPLLRFRLYPPDSAAHKSMMEAFSDCMDCVRNSDRGRLGKARLLATGLPREWATQTSRVFRVGMLTTVLMLATSTAVLARRSILLERRLSTELERITGLTELFERNARESISLDDLDDLRSDLALGLEETAGRLQSLEAQSAGVAALVERAAPSTLFIQGSYAFVQPATEQPLRLVMGTDGRPVTNESGEPALGLGGSGPVFELQYTGTGFVVDAERNLIVTNRHVALPWAFDEAAAGILERGFEGRIVRFRAFLPGHVDPIQVRLVEAHADADVAVLEAVDMPEGVATLSFSRRPVRPGEEVVLLGYPLGIRALVARTDPAFLTELASAGQTGFWEVADRLAGAGHIGPLASRGIVGQVTRTTIVYDAETTSGGSGGPVLDTSGEVVAVNMAILPQFGGSNMGVPAPEGLMLLERVFARDR